MKLKKCLIKFKITWKSNTPFPQEGEGLGIGAETPGAGKMMLAKRLPSNLPPKNQQEALETTKIHSVAGKMGQYHLLISAKPFRSLHHIISDVAMIGGGSIPKPGEISIPHPCLTSGRLLRFCVNINK